LQVLGDILSGIGFLLELGAGRGVAVDGLFFGRGLAGGLGGAGGTV